LSQLYALVKNRNALDGSCINGVERCMNILKLDTDHHSLVKSCSSMKALRDLGDREEMSKGDEPVTVAPSAIEDDVVVLKEVLQNACDDYSETYCAWDDLQKMSNMERRINQDGGFQSAYLSEVRGTCACVPLWLKKLFTYPVRRDMKCFPKDEHFLSYDDLVMKKAFGFITTERYLPSAQGKTSKSGTKEEQDRDLIIKKTYGRIFNQKQLAMDNECHLCHKPWCMFTLFEGAESNNTFETARQYLDNTMPF
jgi:hypothetical protein